MCAFIVTFIPPMFAPMIHFHIFLSAVVDHNQMSVARSKVLGASVSRSTASTAFNSSHGFGSSHTSSAATVTKGILGSPASSILLANPSASFGGPIWKEKEGSSVTQEADQFLTKLSMAHNKETQQKIYRSIKQKMSNSTFFTAFIATILSKETGWLSIAGQLCDSPSAPAEAIDVIIKLGMSGDPSMCRLVLQSGAAALLCHPSADVVNLATCVGACLRVHRGFSTFDKKNGCSHLSRAIQMHVTNLDVILPLMRLTVQVVEYGAEAAVDKLVQHKVHEAVVKLAVSLLSEVSKHEELLRVSIRVIRTFVPSLANTSWFVECCLSIAVHVCNVMPEESAALGESIALRCTDHTIHAQNPRILANAVGLLPRVGTASALSALMRFSVFGIEQLPDDSRKVIPLHCYVGSSQGLRGKPMDVDTGRLYIHLLVQCLRYCGLDSVLPYVVYAHLQRAKDAILSTGFDINAMLPLLMLNHYIATHRPCLGLIRTWMPTSNLVEQGYITAVHCQSFTGVEYNADEQRRLDSILTTKLQTWMKQSMDLDGMQQENREDIETLEQIARNAHRSRMEEGRKIIYNSPDEAEFRRTNLRAILLLRGMRDQVSERWDAQRKEIPSPAELEANLKAECRQERESLASNIDQMVLSSGLGEGEVEKLRSGLKTRKHDIARKYARLEIAEQKRLQWRKTQMDTSYSAVLSYYDAQLDGGGPSKELIRLELKEEIVRGGGFYLPSGFDDHPDDIEEAGESTSALSIAAEEAIAWSGLMRRLRLNPDITVIDRSKPPHESFSAIEQSESLARVEVRASEVKDMLCISEDGERWRLLLGFAKFLRRGDLTYSISVVQRTSDDVVLEETRSRDRLQASFLLRLSLLFQTCSLVSDEERTRGVIIHLEENSNRSMWLQAEMDLRAIITLECRLVQLRWHLQQQEQAARATLLSEINNRVEFFTELCSLLSTTPHLAPLFDVNS